MKFHWSQIMLTTVRFKRYLGLYIIEVIEIKMMFIKKKSEANPVKTEVVKNTFQLRYSIIHLIFILMCR